MVIDSPASNVKKFSSKREQDLGTSRYSSHASAMLGVVAKQKKFQELKKKSFLPQLTRERAFTKSPYPETIGVDEVSMLEDDVITSPVIYRGSASTYKSSSTVVSSPAFRKSAHFSPEKPHTHTFSEDDDDDDDDDDESELGGQSYKSVSVERKRKRSATKLPAINIPQRSAVSSAYEPHSMWLTRERTENDNIEQRIYRNLFPKKKSEIFYRKAYLQLDVLKTGDVFGLDHLQQTLASEPQGFSLLSDGAEIVKISKRFFLQFASNNTMMKVELMYREYLTEDEAKESLYEKETWQQYKNALWDRITEPMPLPNAPHTVR